MNSGQFEANNSNQHQTYSDHKNFNSDNLNDSILCASAYECQYCKKMFCSKSGVIIHVTKFHPLINGCHICKAKFRSADILREHLYEQHKNLPKKCPLCDDDYYSLDIHMKIHAKEYNCF